MKLICKHFNDLTAKELYEILRLRVNVFVVEQNCSYPEVDGKDLDAWHLWFEDEDGIAAAARARRLLQGSVDRTGDREKAPLRDRKQTDAGRNRKDEGSLRGYRYPD